MSESPNPQEQEATPLPTAPAQGKPGFFKRVLRAYKKANGSSLLLSIIIHSIIVVVGIFLVVSQVAEERKISFGGGDPGPKGDIQHKVQMKRKTTSAPAPTKRITTTSSMAKVALPDMPDIPMSMGPTIAGSMGTGGFGASSGLGGGGAGGGGAGNGFSNIKFFGLRTQAKRIAFLVDYSGSMEGAFRSAMEKRLEESLKTLPIGTQMLIIPWAGGAWLYNQKASDISSKWKRGEDYDDFSVAPGQKLDPPAWVSITPETIASLLTGVRGQHSWPGGTDWRSPFHYAMEANPQPDVIFFMSDGQIPPKDVSKKMSQVAVELQKAKIPPVVNCIWIQNKLCDPGPMKHLATKYKGEFRTIDQSGAILEK